MIVFTCPPFFQQTCYCVLTKRPRKEEFLVSSPSHVTRPSRSGKTRLAGYSPAGSCQSVFPRDRPAAETTVPRTLRPAQAQEGVRILTTFFFFGERRETLSLIARAQSMSIPLPHAGNKNAPVLVQNCSRWDIVPVPKQKKKSFFRENKTLKLAVPSNFKIVRRSSIDLRVCANG